MNHCFVVLNWNGFLQTRECVESILKYESSSGIVVVDNGSNQEEASALQEFLAIRGFFSVDQGHEAEVPDLRTSGLRLLYRLNKNHGYAIGNNYGIRLAEQIGFEYITVSNNDIVLTMPLINELTTELSKNHNAAAIGPRVYSNHLKGETNPMRSRSSFFYLFWYRIFYPILLPFDKIHRLNFRTYAGRSRRLETNEFLSGCFVTFDAVKLHQVNYLDENTFLYNEEEILALKLRSKGYESLYCQSVSIMHNNAMTTRTLPSRQVNMHYFNSTLYFVRNYKKYGTFRVGLMKFANFIWANIWLPAKKIIEKRVI